MRIVHLFLLQWVNNLMAATSCLVQTGASAGKQIQAQHRATAQYNRISLLNSKSADVLSDDEAKELCSLMSKKDPYDASLFSQKHQAHKKQHNVNFATLVKNCVQQGGDALVFYLDGENGGTTRVLQQEGFASSNLYVANMYQDTVNRLKSDFAGLTNVYLGRAEEVLRCEPLASTQFRGYYLDLCGGFTSPLLDLVSSIFGDSRMNAPSRAPSFGLGFTLLNEDGRGISSLVDREQDITRALFSVSKKHDYKMQYVGDDPCAFGLTSSPIKRLHGDQASTTWLVFTSTRPKRPS